MVAVQILTHNAGKHKPENGEAPPLVKRILDTERRRERKDELRIFDGSGKPSEGGDAVPSLTEQGKTEARKDRLIEA